MLKSVQKCQETSKKCPKMSKKHPEKHPKNVQNSPKNVQRRPKSIQKTSKYVLKVKLYQNMTKSSKIKKVNLEPLGEAHGQKRESDAYTSGGISIETIQVENAPVQWILHELRYRCTSFHSKKDIHSQMGPKRFPFFGKWA